MDMNEDNLKAAYTAQAPNHQCNLPGKETTGIT